MSTAAAPRLFDPDAELAELLDAPAVRGIDDRSLGTRPGAPGPIEDVIVFEYLDYFIVWE